MSQFNVGDVVRIGNGKVEYVVASLPTDLKDKTTVESMNTGKAQDVDTSRLTLLRAADTDPMNVPQTLDTPVETQDFVDLVASVDAEQEEDFDAREDRRQSAYGLAILAAVMRKGANNPKQFAHNSNASKSVRGKRVKVRTRVRKARHNANTLNAEYNAMRRNTGYFPNATAA